MIKKTFVVTMFVLFALLYSGNSLLITFENKNSSTLAKVNGIDCIQNAKRMPTNGPNFKTYSHILSTFGRTHLHSELRTVLLESYKILKTTAPHVTWIYAEMGWKNGHHFWPHKTHRNGLCVDFIVPVLNQENAQETLFLWPFNAYGYNIRFDDKGLHKHYKIDFPSIILHINSLKISCSEHGLQIKRIILDPPLLKRLRNEASYSLIADIPFMEKHAWFPHDAHYHIDFAFKQ